MQEEVYFINEEGKKVYIENVMSHIGIANKIIESNDTLQEEFLQSGEQNPITFLISKKSYMAVSNMNYYRKITYDSACITEINKEILGIYVEDGYGLTDFERERKMLERGEI